MGRRCYSSRDSCPRGHERARPRPCPGVALVSIALAAPGDSGDPALDAAQQWIADWAPGQSGAPLIVSGPAGSGKSEALARRIAARGAAGTEPESTLVFTRTP